MRYQILHGHFPLQEQPYFGRADVVLDELGDNMYVILPLLQACERIINISSGPLDYEGAVCDELFPISFRAGRESLQWPRI